MQNRTKEIKDLSEISYPAVLSFSVKWYKENSKIDYKSYTKTVNDKNHLDNIENYYEKRGGKVIGTFLISENDK